MKNITLHIANSAGSMNKHINKIKSAFDSAKNSAVNDLGIDKVDVVFVDAPYNTIPELGVGGYTPSPHLIYVSVTPAHDILEEEIKLSLLHEFHHAARWRDPGYGERCDEALISEGLACLYEEEKKGKIPIYAKTDISEAVKKFELSKLEDSNYNHYELFIAGNSVLPRWFGYAYGYEAARKTAEKLSKTASELVNEPIDSFQQSLRALVSDI